MIVSPQPQPFVIDDPLLALGQWLQNLQTVFTEQPLLIVLFGLLAILMVIEISALMRYWRDWQHRQRLQGAQEVVILPPAQVEPHGVDLWWDQVASLLRRSGWRRLLYGPAHIAYELRWSEQELTIVVWVPGTVPAEHIAAAVRAAWSGATATVRPASPGLEVITGTPNVSAARLPAAQPNPSVGLRKGRSRPGIAKTAPREAHRRPTEGRDVAGHWYSRLPVKIFDRLLGQDGAEPSDSSATAPPTKPNPRSGQTGSPSLPLPDASSALAVPEGFEVFTVGRQVLAKLPGWYPFRDRAHHGVDPMRALIEQGTGLSAGLSACVQVLVRPPSARRVQRIRAGAAGLKTGQRQRDGGLARGVLGPLTAGTGALAGRILLGVLDIAVDVLESILSAFIGGSSSAGRRTSTRQGMNAGTTARRVGTNPLQDQDARPALEKVRTGQLWEVSIRIAVTRTVRRPTRPGTESVAARKDRVEKIQAGLHQRAHALAAALGVHDDRNGLRALSLSKPERELAERRMGRGFVMGTPELASLAALPTDVAVAGLDRAQARTVPAPTGLPYGGRGVKILGLSSLSQRTIGLSAEDSRLHVHVMGSTGVGKSTLLCRMILADINAGRGVVLIDPKGDLALDVLDRFPEHALPRLTLIDPDQPVGSAGFNPLQERPGMDPVLQVDNLTNIFHTIFGNGWGERMDDTMRVSCLTLMRHPGARLTLVPALLNNKQFRARITADLKDASGLGGFWQGYDEVPVAQRAQSASSVLARLRSFLLRDFVRFTIGRETSSFDMGQVLDGGVLIVRIPKGQLGEDASKLLGTMVLSLVWQAATARSGIEESKRKDAIVYTDEAHNVLNLGGPVNDMLAEARGYRLSFVLAHQNLGQLSSEIQEGLSSNARNKVFFNCSPEDAHRLAKHTDPELSEHDLSHLGPFVAAARLMTGDLQMRSFTLSTVPLPAPEPGARQRVRDYIRLNGPQTPPEVLADENELP